MMVRGLIERQAATRYVLTEPGAQCWRRFLSDDLEGLLWGRPENICSF
jgi:hypothetical protein